MKISKVTPKKKKISKLFFPSFSSKNLSFQIFSRKFPNFLIFRLQLMKNYENSLMKRYSYGNASRKKIVKAARLKMFEIIDKSRSKL
jgi:hypothetical protein